MGIHVCAYACENTYTNVCGNLRKNAVSCKAARTIYLLANTKFHFSRAVDGVRLNHAEHRRGRARGKAGLPWERRLSLKECGESVGPALPGQGACPALPRGAGVPGGGWQLGGGRSRGQWEGRVSPWCCGGSAGLWPGGSLVHFRQREATGTQISNVARFLLRVPHTPAL